jgi:uncharacterized protein YggT (Ycf19 family)
MMRVKYYLNLITNPYMNRFRGIPWLRTGNLDLSPLLAFLILYFGIYITGSMASGVFPTVLDMLFWLVRYVWEIVTGLFMFFGIIMLFRLLMLYASRGSSSSFLTGLDRFLFPVVSRFLGFFTNRTLSYPLALGITAVSFIAVRFLGRWGMGKLLDFLWKLLKTS